MAKKRKINEVDASSIADIAFILLAFIIVVTTLQEEEGIPAVLPQKRDVDQPKPPILRKKNILQIMVNKNNQIMIEEQWDKTLDDVKPMVMEFMTNPSGSEDLPTMVKVDRVTCQKQIAILSKAVEEGDTDKSKKLKEWEDKLEAVKLLGEYKTLPKVATIALQYDKGTSYGTYLGVRDRIMSGINELRDDKCLEAFNISYKALEGLRAEVKTEEDKAKMRAIRQVYPQKIIKLPARNVQTN